MDRLLDRRYLLDLCEQNPDAALTYLRITKELVGHPGFAEAAENEFGHELFDRILHGLHTGEAREDRPARTLGYLNILREMGGSDYPHRWSSRRIDETTLLNRFLSYELASLAKRLPEVALNCIRAIRELFSEHAFSHFVAYDLIPEFSMAVYNPNRLLDLSRGNPRALIVYSQILWELNDIGFLGSSELHRSRRDEIRMDDLTMLIRYSLPGTLIYLKILEDLLDQSTFDSTIEEMGKEPEFVSRLLDPRGLFELAEWDAGTALKCLPLLQAIGRREAIHQQVRKDFPAHYAEEMIRRALHTSAHNPVAALTYLRILEALDIAKIAQNFAAEQVNFERAFHARQLTHEQQQGLNLLCFWLAYARLFRPSSLISLLGRTLIAETKDHNHFAQRLSTLPISSLSDLRWLSEQIGNPRLEQMINRLIE